MISIDDLDKPEQERDVPQVASFSGVYADSEPCITPDGKRLYFGSRRLLENGEIPNRPYIWMMDRFNSTANEMCASVSPDGKYLLYESIRNDDLMNIYWVDAKILDEFRLDDHK